MKTMICHCEQCRATRARTPKRNRIQTYQVRAARSKVREMLHKLPVDELDNLPEKIVVDYYS